MTFITGNPNIPEHNPIIKFYISAKVNAGEDDVQKVADTLEGLGYQWSYDWRMSKINKPYLDPQHIDDNRGEAENMVNGIMDSDLFILIASDNLVGSYVEFGIAIGLGIPVIVIGAARQSLFYTLANVTVLDTMADFTPIFKLATDMYDGDGYFKRTIGKI